MYISITDLKEYFFNFLLEGVNHQQVTRGAAVGAQLSLKKNDSNQNIFSLPFRRIFPLVLWLLLAILRRFLPLCIVFGPKTTVTSCEDADFFPGMIHTYIYIHYSSICIHI